MKKMTVTLCGILLLGAATAPALGQPGPGAWSLDNRVNAVQGGIDRAVNDGSLDRPQYDHVQHELNAIRQKRDIYMQTHGGQLSPPAMQRLEIDLDNVINQIHWIRGEWRRPW